MTEGDSPMDTPKTQLRQLLINAYDAGYSSALDDPNRTRTEEDIEAYCDRYGYEEVDQGPAADLLAALQTELFRLPPVARPVDHWDCEAYGSDPAVIATGARCYFAEPHQRKCLDRTQCARAMAAERELVYGRITEMAANGDETGIYLAEQFDSPDQILNADAAPRWTVETEAAALFVSGRTRGGIAIAIGRELWMFHELGHSPRVHFTIGFDPHAPAESVRAVARVEVTAELARWLLECVRCSSEEGWSPKIGDRNAEPAPGEVEQLIATLAGIAGVRPDQVVDQ